MFQSTLFIFIGFAARHNMPLNPIDSPVLEPTAPASVMPWSARLFLSLGALSACASVVLSAAFAHLPVFAGSVPVVVQTALAQHQFHALGLLLTGLAICVCRPTKWLLAAGGLMVLGLVLFSFNLYARHVLGFDALKALVPWGGMAWIWAWLSLMVGFLKAHKAPSTTA